MRSYVRDNVEMLDYLQKRTKETPLLVSVGVINLYSNIARALGLEAIEVWIDNHPQQPQGHISRYIIMRGLKFILENIYFIFYKEYYCQESGKAMDTRMAPSFANLFMGYLENNLYQKTLENMLTPFQNILRQMEEVPRRLFHNLV